MKIVNIGEREKGRIKKMKQYTLDKFEIIVHDKIPLLKVKKVNKPWYMTSKTYNGIYNSGYYIGVNYGMNVGVDNVINYISKSIDEVNVHTTKVKRKKK